MKTIFSYFNGLIVFASMVGIIGSISGSAFAIDIFQPCTEGGAGASSVCQTVKAQNAAGTNPINKALKDVLNLVSFVAGGASVILITISAIRFITSQGDAAGVKSARDTVLYTLIGIFVIVVAQTIIVFVLDKLKL